jgi:microcystin-dependent protein
MADAFTAEIRMFAGTFAPVGWALCNGQLLPISEYEGLFLLIGTTYGGDGENTFALPDLQGRVPVHMGQGPGLSNYVIAEKGGVEGVTLTAAQLPSHAHTARGRSGIGTSDVPANRVWAAPSEPSAMLYGPTGNSVNMAAASIQNAGGSQPHENMPPFLAINFIICLSGIFPSQT